MDDGTDPRRRRRFGHRHAPTHGPPRRPAERERASRSTACLDVGSANGVVSTLVSRSSGRRQCGWGRRRKEARAAIVPPRLPGRRERQRRHFEKRRTPSVRWGDAAKKRGRRSFDRACLGVGSANAVVSRSGERRPCGWRDAAKKRGRRSLDRACLDVGSVDGVVSRSGERRPCGWRDAANMRGRRSFDGACLDVGSANGVVSTLVSRSGERRPRAGATPQRSSGRDRSTALAWASGAPTPSFRRSFREAANAVRAGGATPQRSSGGDRSTEGAEVVLGAARILVLPKATTPQKRGFTWSHRPRPSY